MIRLYANYFHANGCLPLGETLDILGRVAVYALSFLDASPSRATEDHIS